MTGERLMEFSEAWNQRDPDILMTYMADDCSYQMSYGPELLGRDFRGREAVRQGFREFFDRFPDGHFEDAELWVFDDDRAATSWTFTWTDEQGAKRAVRGCDLFEFEGDKIKQKNAFRKLQ
jgi:nuclear transport factor 2 (NTF2) superfamily protein